MFSMRMRNWQILSLLAALAVMLAVLVPTAAADKHSEDGTFNVLVSHGINGTRLGLSKELPVVAIVERNGEVLAEIPLKFKETFQAELPAGNYFIQIKSVELNQIIDTMTVGPVDIPGGVKVALLARLDDGTPVTKVKIRDLK